MIDAMAPRAAGPVAGLASAHPPAPEGMCFCGIPITETQAFPPPEGPHCWVYVTLNAEIALSHPHNPALQTVLRSGRARVSVDGQWLWWGLRRKYPGCALTKLSGSDLIYRIAAHCAMQGRRLLLLGASARSNARAVSALRRRWPDLEVAGFSPHHYSQRTVAEPEAHAECLRAIRAFHADYVVLGLGCSKELGLAQATLCELDGQVAGLCCFGGAIDLASGLIKRAPPAWQRLGLECVYRTLQQPSRLGRLLRMTRLLPLLISGHY
jgi:UDP-N-acetyl-D-mannosaminouronate:lipid I N-acetyl-D-mannosaminouronosyltransferase